MATKNARKPGDQRAGKGRAQKKASTARPPPLARQNSFGSNFGTNMRAFSASMSNAGPVLSTRRSSANGANGRRPSGSMSSVASVAGPNRTRQNLLRLNSQGLINGPNLERMSSRNSPGRSAQSARNSRTTSNMYVTASSGGNSINRASSSKSLLNGSPSRRLSSDMLRQIQSMMSRGMSNTGSVRLPSPSPSPLPPSRKPSPSPLPPSRKPSPSPLPPGRKPSLSLLKSPFFNKAKNNSANSLVRGNSGRSNLARGNSSWGSLARSLRRGSKANSPLPPRKANSPLPPRKSNSPPPPRKSNSPPPPRNNTSLNTLRSGNSSSSLGGSRELSIRPSELPTYVRPARTPTPQPASPGPNRKLLAKLAIQALKNQGVGKMVKGANGKYKNVVRGPGNVVSQVNTRAYKTLYSDNTIKNLPVVRGPDGGYYYKGKEVDPKKVKVVPLVNKTEQLYRIFNASYNVNNNTGRVTTNLFDKNQIGNGGGNGKAKGQVLCPAETLSEGLGSAKFKACLAARLGKRLQDMFAKDADDARAGRQCGRGPDGKFPATKQRKQLGQHQIVVENIARMLAAYAQDPSKAGGSRGLLAWHNTGSGKSLSSLAIMKAYMESSKKQLYMVTTVENRDNNNAEKYAENAMDFYPDWFPQGSMSKVDWKKHIAAQLRKRVDWLSYEELANRLGLGVGGRKFKLTDGAGCAVLMDEAQSIANPVRMAETTDKLRVLLRCDPSDPKSAAVFRQAGDTPDAVLKKAHMYALTATPGGSIKEWMDTMTFVRRVGQRAFTLADWNAGKINKSDFAGLISYVEMRDDLSRYASEKVINIAAPMDPLYFAAYARFFATLKDDDFKFPDGTDAEDKKINYLSDLRKMGLYLIKTGPAGFGTWYKADAFERAKAQGLVLTGQGGRDRLLATKFKYMIDNVTKLPGKQYIWVSTFDGVRIVEDALEQRFGRNARLKPSQFESVKSGQDNQGNDKYEAAMYRSKMGPAPRFVSYTQEVGESANKGAFADIRSMFSDERNAEGAFCKIIIATRSNYQGLDITGLRGVHIVEPLFDDIADEQARGRGRRNCGHAMLPAQNRNVTVYRYWSVPPAGSPEAVVKMITDITQNSAGKDAKGRVKKPTKTTTQALQEVERGLRDMTRRFALTSSSNGGNSALYRQAHARNEELRRFELCIKGVAIDCHLFKNMWHKNEPFQCSDGGSLLCPATKPPETPAQTIVIPQPSVGIRPNLDPARDPKYKNVLARNAARNAAAAAGRNVSPVKTHKNVKDWLMSVAGSSKKSQLSSQPSMQSKPSSSQSFKTATSASGSSAPVISRMDSRNGRARSMIMSSPIPTRGMTVVVQQTYNPKPRRNLNNRYQPMVRSRTI